MAETLKSNDQAVAASPLSSSFQFILEDYAAARRDQRFGKSSSPWVEIQRATQEIRSSSVAKSFPEVVFNASVGQGNWATIPWIAALDSRETSKTSEGVYVIYLFRADMTGLYLTLNQATSPVMSGYTDVGATELRRRASLLRQRAGSLVEAGFTVDKGIVLRSNAATARGYEASTAAFKLYERGKIPNDESLLSDLESALKVCGTLIPSRRIFGSV